ncbi:MAG: hypothetical protein OXF67_08795 [Cyanobacteria bacterium MAG CAR4_bin_6]|nr:hypothetical protein [Cyanobacteria bacterium MAG CAR4_bin_6]
MGIRSPYPNPHLGWAMDHHRGTVLVKKSRWVASVLAHGCGVGGVDPIAQPG